MTRAYGFREACVADLGSVLALDVVARSGLRLGVDPLGGAGVHYWPAIADRYRLTLTVISDTVDPTFAFMTFDCDGRIRTDPRIDAESFRGETHLQRMEADARTIVAEAIARRRHAADLVPNRQ